MTHIVLVIATVLGCWSAAAVVLGLALGRFLRGPARPDTRPAGTTRRAAQWERRWDNRSKPSPVLHLTRR